MPPKGQSEHSRPAKPVAGMPADPLKKATPPPSIPPLQLLDSIKRNRWNSAEHKQAVNCIRGVTSGKQRFEGEEEEEEEVSIQTPAPRRTSRVSNPSAINGPKDLQFLEDGLKLVNPYCKSPAQPSASVDSSNKFRIAKGRARKAIQASPASASHKKPVHKHVYKYISDSEGEDSDSEEQEEFVTAISKRGSDLFASAKLSTPAASHKTTTPHQLFGSKPNSSLAVEPGPSTPTRSQVALQLHPQQVVEQEQSSIPAAISASPKKFLTAYASIFGEDDPGPEPSNSTPSVHTTNHQLEITMSSAATALGVFAPNQTRSLRACMVCCIIRPLPQFMNDGCPNCEPALQMQGSADTINECTSSNFNGIIAIMTPGESWVAKYHRLDGYVPGMYAVQVIGNLPDDYVEQIRSSGMRFVRRDGNKDEDEEAMGA